MPTPYIAQNTLNDIEIYVNSINNGLGLLFKEAIIIEEANKISTAKIKFAGSNLVTEGIEKPALNDLNIYEDNQIRHITVVIKNDQTNIKIFEGIIKSYNKQIEGQEIIIHIECKDACFKLTHHLPTSNIEEPSFEDTTLHYIQYANVAVDNLYILEGRKEQIQINPSIAPWDYVVAYADSIGYWTTVKHGTIKFVDFNVPKDSLFLADNAINVFDFKAKLDPARKKSKITLSYWNIENQETSTIEVEQDAYPYEENIQAGNCFLQESTLLRIIASRLKRSELASIYGHIATYGNSIVSIGDYIQVKNVNAAIDNKDLIVSKIEHSIQEGNWRTTYYFGIETEQSFVEQIFKENSRLQNQIGQTNSVEGLMIGIVTQLAEDPLSLGRIKIKLPLINNQTDGIWARMANLFAGNNSGGYFIPDIGDEVVIGFMGNNLDNPIVLGSLHNPIKNAVINHNDNNAIKGIYTAGGSKMEWNDDKKSIEISNSKGDKVIISDDEKGISITDQNANQIRLNEDGIKINAERNIEITATNTLRIKATKIEIEASGMVDIKGSIIKLN